MYGRVEEGLMIKFSLGRGSGGCKNLFKIPFNVMLMMY